METLMYFPPNLAVTTINSTVASMFLEEFIKYNVLYKDTNDILDLGGAVDTFGAL